MQSADSGCSFEIEDDMCMTNDIRIIEKPDSVAYQTVLDVLTRAHQINFDRGIVFKITAYTSEYFEERLRKKAGKCFVAMDGEKVVATASCWIGDKAHWYSKGRYMKWMHVGVLPEYKGRHIAQELLKAVEDETKAQGLDRVFFDTAEKNEEMLKFAKKNGFRRVGFFSPTSDHYSVELMKWLNGCPYSSITCIGKYNFQRIVTRFRYKPGKIRRFG